MSPGRGNGRTRRREGGPLGRSTGLLRHGQEGHERAGLGRALRTAARRAESAECHGPRPILLFVHGDNVTFPEAVRRTAQLAFDLGCETIPVCFSWPSAGRLLHYAGDRETAEWSSEPHLVDFLHELATRGGRDRIHLAAHSLGTLCLCRALVQYRAKAWRTDPFDNLVLASPDIERDIFVGRLLPHVGDSLIARSVTLYASSRDWALAMSAMPRMNDIPRAGTGGASMVVVKGIDSVDSSKVESGLVNHSFFMDAEPLLRDVFGLLARRLAPPRRELEPATRDGLRYWILHDPSRAHTRPRRGRGRRARAGAVLPAPPRATAA